MPWPDFPQPLNIIPAVLIRRTAGLLCLTAFTAMAQPLASLRGVATGKVSDRLVGYSKTGNRLQIPADAAGNTFAEVGFKPGA